MIQRKKEKKIKIKRSRNNHFNFYVGIKRLMQYRVIEPKKITKKNKVLLLKKPRRYLRPS
jgi:hypothetical protein